MQTRRLGRLGHDSSVLIYGAASLSDVDQDRADASIQEALDAGHQPLRRGARLRRRRAAARPVDVTDSRRHLPGHQDGGARRGVRLAADQRVARAPPDRPRRPHPAARGLRPRGPRPAHRPGRRPRRGSPRQGGGACRRHRHHRPHARRTLRAHGSAATLRLRLGAHPGELPPAGDPAYGSTSTPSLRCGAQRTPPSWASRPSRGATGATTRRSATTPGTSPSTSRPGDPAACAWVLGTYPQVTGHRDGGGDPAAARRWSRRSRPVPDVTPDEAAGCWTGSEDYSSPFVAMPF